VSGRAGDRLVDWLFTHRVGGKVISQETRVDPARFAENEFPVFCRKCDYALRGLPDGHCPECGTEFQRGRLLVEQYVLRTRSLSTRLGRFAVRCFLGGAGIGTLAFLVLCVVYLVHARNPSGLPNLDVLGFELQVAQYAMCSASVVFLIGFVTLLAALLRNGQKRRRVLAAIGDPDRE
jgi:hypothetical protein